MHPKMIPVLSSAFSGYLHLSDGTLLVTFKRGAVYAYDGVPKDVIDGMHSASSKGSYLNAHIVKGNFRHREVTNDELDRLLADEVAGVTRREKQTRCDPARLHKLSARHPVLQLAF
jgi:hypothetical protein